MRLAMILGPVSLALQGPAPVASPFNGVWVDNLDTHVTADHTDVYLVAGGNYRCASCRPPRGYPADGVARAIPGDMDTISEAVTVIGPRAIVTRIVGPDMVRETTMTVSSDNKAATYVSLDQWPGQTERLKTVFRARRVAPAPPGAHPVSGSWRAVRYVEVPEAYRSVELNETADTLTVSNIRRGSYTATYDAPPAPLPGGSENTGVKVSRPDTRTRVETILKNGKPVVERTYKLSEDGQSMRETVNDISAGEVFKSIAYRKSD